MQEFFASIGFLEPLIVWLFDGVSAYGYISAVNAIFVFVILTHTCLYVYANSSVSAASTWLHSHWTKITLIAVGFATVWVIGPCFDGIHYTGKYAQTSQAIALYADGDEEREIPVEIIRYRIIGTDDVWTPWEVKR